MNKKTAGYYFIIIFSFIVNAFVTKAQTGDILSNNIFIPEGTHGNIGKVSFIPNEMLYLHPGWNWISFPRVYRDITDPDYPDSYYSAVSALTHRIMPEDYFIYDKNQMINLPPNNSSGNLISIDWNLSNQKWEPNGLDYIKSTRGYKIYIEPPENEHYLYLRNTVLDASQPITVYAGENIENWVGYFLPETQDPLEALTNVFPNLQSIKAEKWAGYNAGTEAKPNWIISKTTPLRYGDMLILKTYHDGSFTWHRAGNPFGNQTGIEQPSHYSFNKTDSYTSFFIEYDTLNPPVEIGAFVNDTCVGACKIVNGDTLAFLQAYLPESGGDSVVFENYYGNKSTEKTVIKSYYVQSRGETTPIKRVVKTGENKDFYLISFKKPAEQPVSKSDIKFDIGPNPVTGKLFITYFLPYESNVNVSVYDMAGRLITMILQKTEEKGSYHAVWNLTDSNGIKLKKGIYLLHYTIGTASGVKKVVVR